MLGRYIIEQPFATGSQARIFRAHDRLTGSKCLLKTGDAVRKEAFLSRELNHPYIAKPYDFGVCDEIGTYAVYEEIPYLSLSDWRRAKPSGDLRKTALEIAEVLCYIHHCGWLYNDFKPEHFLVGEDGVKVIDLGLCSRLENSSESHPCTYDGTFPFISPERLVGRSSDQRSDIFAFGILLLHLFFPEEDWAGEP